jgi:hypothetical protein
MQPRIPEKNKKANICYAITDEGLELPVIDVTRPEFQVALSEGQLDEQLQQFVRDAEGPGRLPPLLRRLMFALMSRQSRLMRGLRASDGAYLSGLNTYFLKLGPDNLNRGYFSEIDRRIASSSAGLFMRLRLQDVSHLLAEALSPVLQARRSARLRLLNIGGGSAIDSLNALIVIRSEQAGLLEGRHIAIDILDLNEQAPNFGARALAALQGENAPLHGLDVDFEHIRYDWSRPATLREHLNAMDGGAIVAASSEGALFEYGSDDEVIGNLRALSDGTPADSIVAGSVTRGDELGRKLNGRELGSRALLHLRGLEAFAALARQAGWAVARSIDRPLSHDVLLKKV